MKNKIINIFTSSIALTSLFITSHVNCYVSITSTYDKTLDESIDKYVWFNFDSWENVCKYASEGIESLHKHYILDCQNNKYFPNTLIGLERTIYLEGCIHKVRVIDEQHDYLAETGSNINTASLTFELVNVLSSIDKKAEKIKWDQNEWTSYTKSNIYNKLNNGDDKWSIYNQLLSNKIKLQHIQKKYCNDSDGLPSLYNTYVSLLTFDELMLPQYKVNLISNGYGKINNKPDGFQLICDEGKKWIDIYKSIKVTPNDGYIFDGWVDSDGKKIDDNFEITSDFTGIAKFVQKSISYKPNNLSIAKHKITLISDKNGFIKSATTVEVDDKTKWNDVKNNIELSPINKFYDFDRWTTADGKKINDDYEITSDFTALANFKLSQFEGFIYSFWHREQIHNDKKNISRIKVDVSHHVCDYWLLTSGSITYEPYFIDIDGELVSTSKDDQKGISFTFCV